MARKNNGQPTKNKVTEYEIILKLVKSLHLKNLPNSFKGNIVCDLVLLVGLIIIIAEPAFAYCDSMLTTICNFILSLCSKDLLPPKNVDASLTSEWVIIIFAVAVMACPTIVALLGGFKHVEEE